MQIANYQIELPISLEFSYQLLYRGFDETKQSYYINIFPKSELDSTMYEGICRKHQSYHYIKDAFEDDNNILISYLNSNAWIKMPSKITNNQFNLFLKQLYDLYSLDNLGLYDFNPDFLYINQQTVYIIDYGLRYSRYQIQYQQQYNNNYEQNQLIKTWMFGSLLYCLTTGTKDTSFLIKLNQQQINYCIEYNCRQNNINEENINFIKLLLRADYDIRPTFDQLANLPILQNRQFIKIHSQPSSNNQKQRTIIKLDNLDNQIPKSTFQCTQSQFVLTLQLNIFYFSLIQSTVIDIIVKLKWPQNQINFVLPKDSLKILNQILINMLNNQSNPKLLVNMDNLSRICQLHSLFILKIKSKIKLSKMNNLAKIQELIIVKTIHLNYLQKNLSINIDVIKPNRTTSVNTKSLDQQSTAETNPLPIKAVKENKFEFKQKPRKNQINSFESNFFLREEEDDEADINF